MSHLGSEVPRGELSSTVCSKIEESMATLIFRHGLPLHDLVCSIGLSLERDRPGVSSVHYQYAKEVVGTSLAR